LFLLGVEETLEPLSAEVLHHYLLGGPAKILPSHASLFEEGNSEGY